MYQGFFAYISLQILFLLVLIENLIIMRIPESELILNPDGSVYHLHLKPGEVASKVILVGDQARVDTVASFFSSKEFVRQNREFRTVTGKYKNERITVLSTGIGTDNVDIVLNELDALANIDLNTRTVKDTHSSYSFVRIGTSGSLQEDIPVDTPVITEIASGFDGLINFYDGYDSICDIELEHKFTKFMNWPERLAKPYFVDGNPALVSALEGLGVKGITISAPGFYGPQGRVLRLELVDPYINEKIQTFKWNGKRITNYEMESSAIYGLSALLGHKAVTVCNIVANRYKKQYSQNHHQAMLNTIGNVLEILIAH